MQYALHAMQEGICVKLQPQLGTDACNIQHVGPIRLLWQLPLQDGITDQLPVQSTKNMAVIIIISIVVINM